MKNSNSIIINFQLKSVFLLFITIELSHSAIEVPKPRGVSISRIPLYDPKENFTCFDGSKVIPYYQVNDDYCDCQDSSDEPGTSACANGKFYCTNAGHKPKILTSDRVNDGICDCCDGSDEYSNRKTCENNCLELGQAAKEEKVRLAKILKMGKQLRSEISQEGQQLKKEKYLKVQDLRKHKEEAEKLKAEKEELKVQAEELENKALEYYRGLEEQLKKKQEEKEAEKSEKEALEWFKKLDTNTDGLIDIAEVKSSKAFSNDPNAEITDERANVLLSNQNSVNLETFLEKAWPLMKQFIRIDSSAFKQPVDGEPKEGETKTEDKNAEKHQTDAKDDDESDDDEEENIYYMSDSEGEGAKDSESQSPQITYDENTQNLVNLATEARNLFIDAEKNVVNLDAQIRTLEESLNRDFGPDEEFSTLEGNCFEYINHEYTYKLCPFDKTVQVPKSNSMETNLGRWASWNGPANNPYEVMIYNNGHNCWNGPNRSTKVKISCGLENKLTSVSEPNRCEYFFQFETPAACREPRPGEQDDLHDEL